MFDEADSNSRHLGRSTWTEDKKEELWKMETAVEDEGSSDEETGE